MLYVSRAGWWEADFLLDPELPNELEVGQPVSVGLSYPKNGSGSTYLREISIVRHGAVKGAAIISRSEMPQTPPKPTPKTTELELHLIRRVQWKETRARLAALGIDVTNYREPLPLHRSEMESTSVKPGEVIYGDRTIVRRNIGQVLGVR